MSMFHSVALEGASKLTALPADITLRLPQGQRIGAPDAPVKLSLSSWSTIAWLKAGRIGALAEDYVEGKLEFEGTMRDLMREMAKLIPGNPVRSQPGWWPGLLRRTRSLGLHTPAKDAEQIEFHYDVSDAFYALWLDPRRVYSCAYYRADGMTLAEAQEAKLDHICRKLLLRPGERFLDIGAGWGALLLWAAEHYGVDATGITLSKNQHAHVTKLIDQKGLGQRVRIELRDYRELPEDRPFDKIASVGMFEHVGQAHMDPYFAKIMRLVSPGGLVMNHGITASGLEHSHLGAGMGEFIEKYIFPGGELLHVSAVLEHLSRSGLEMVDTENLRPHYARTLWAWSDALESSLSEARAVLAGDGNEAEAEKILRAYRLYLAGSAMSFENGWVALHQVLATRPSREIEAQAMNGAHSAYPFTRDYMYR